MIQTFALSETERFFATGKSRRLPQDILKRSATRLTQLDGATCLEDLRLPPSMRISHVIKGDRPVTAELALLIGRAFNQSPQYWLNLQASYDLKIAKTNIGKRLNNVHCTS